MKLLRCHIDNFGKLTDYTVDFTRNPQVFYAPNGWGKSTLAAFIKVMFYGFAGESKRGATLEKERLRYKPWQGGVYGGELTFAVGDKTYVLNRTFGSKEAEDTFALYDGTTRLPSEDYSVNIGEELFQINQESFLRTVFLAQSDCDTFATDSINAKIGNLADNLDDINKYEKVQLLLKDLRNSMSPTRKTGSLKKQKESIAERKDALRKVAFVEAAVAEIEQKISACGAEKIRLSQEKAKVQEQWEEVSHRRVLEAAKTHYDSIVNQCEEKQKRADALLESMGGIAPKKEAVAAMQKQCKLWQEQESLARAYCLQEQEKQELERLQARFAQGVPSKERLQEGQELLQRLETLRLAAAANALDESELAEKRELEAWFGCEGSSVAERESRMAELEATVEQGVRCVSDYMEHKNALPGQLATLRSLQAMDEQQKLQQEQNIQQWKEQYKVQNKLQWIAFMAFVVGLILATTGGVLLAFAGKVAGIALLGTGAVLAVLGGILLLVGRKGKAAIQRELDMAAEEDADSYDQCYELEQEIAFLEEQMAADQETVAHCLAEIEGTDVQDDTALWENPLDLRDRFYAQRDELKKLQRFWAKELDYQSKGYDTQKKELQEQLAELLNPYFGPVSEKSQGECLATLFKEQERFAFLCRQEEKYHGACQEAEEYRQKIADFVAQHDKDTSDLYHCLQRLAAGLSEYETTCGELDRLKEEKLVFETKNDISAFATVDGMPADSEERLKEQMNQLEERFAQTEEQLHGYRRQLEDQQAQLEELAEQRELLSLEEAEYEKDLVYYTRIGYVSEYLEKAKESLSAKYIGPIQESFGRYYELLAGESAEDFRMDANVNVTKRALGEQRETGAFSAGNKDLIHIVLRVALVDAMYQKEKPFLVLDDSFVNLDGERLAMAGEFLKQIARDYQVIYFTCHESRMWTD